MRLIRFDLSRWHRETFSRQGRPAKTAVKGSSLDGGLRLLQWARATRCQTPIRGSIGECDGTPSPDVIRASVQRDNVTPREDYRTALLFR